MEFPKSAFVTNQKVFKNEKIFEKKKKKKKKKKNFLNGKGELADLCEMKKQ